MTEKTAKGSPAPAPADSAPAPDPLTVLDDAKRAAEEREHDGQAEVKRGPGRPRVYANDAERRAAHNARRARRATNPAAEVAADKVVAATRVRETRDMLAARLAETEAERDALQEKLRAAYADPAALAGLLRTTFDVAGRILASRRKNDVWLLEPWESEELGRAYALALAPQWDRFAQYTPIAVAAIATWGVVDARIQVEAGALTREQFQTAQAAREGARNQARVALDSPAPAPAPDQDAQEVRNAVTP